MIRTILRAIRSIKLAVALIVLIALGSGIAGFLPQDSAVGGFFHNWFHSPVFYVLAGLFILNLGACTAHRIAVQVTKKGRRRFGPDLLHVGLLVLIGGALLGSATKQESSFWMSKGDGVSLPGGRQLSLVDFEYRSYPDGRPQAWISTVELSPAPGKAGGASRRAIEVNHPLRIGSVSIYQVGYSKTTAALFGNSKAELVRVFGGQTSELAGLGPVFFMAQEGAGPTAQGLFTVTEAAGKKAYRLSLGESLGDWSLEDLREVEVTGLRAATDPGYPAVFAGFILIALGLGLTYIQKLKDMKP